MKDPLPYLFICAFVVNAASFVLPISNPANLVVFGGGHMPPLLDWLRLFTLPSVLAIVATYAALRLAQRKALAAETIAAHVERPALTLAEKAAGFGIILTALVLVGASWAGLSLGLPTLVAGAVTAVGIVALKRENPKIVAAVPCAIHIVLTDNGVQLTNRASDRYAVEHIFNRVCDENGIEHRLTKVKYPWANGQVERMNGIIKDATVERFHYDDHEQFRRHLADFIATYNFGRRLKTIKGRTPYEFICK